MGDPAPKDDSMKGDSSLKHLKRKKKKKKKKENKKSKEEKQTSAETNQSKIESAPQESASTEPIDPKSTATKPKQSNAYPKGHYIIQQIPPGSHPFEVDDSDHCETPLRAYQDIAFLLDQLLLPTKNSKINRKRSRSSLRIYDPYYCDGGVKMKLASLGFTNVINENRDFYQDIANNQIPEHDILVTNPPYSGEHMEKLLDFCKTNRKPSFLLLPHFVYTKDYYSRALGSFARDFCFLVPSMRYSYIPPAWVQHKTGSKALARGKDQTAPFPSFWYACHLQNTTISKEWLANTFGPSGSVRSQHTPSGLRYAAIPAQIPRDFKGEFDPTKKRPNPRARKRMRMAAAAASANGAPLHLPQKQQQKQRQRQRDPKKKKKRRY